MKFTRQSAAGNMLIAALWLLSVQTMSAQEVTSCEDLGATLIAKFEWRGGQYRLEVGPGGVTLQGNTSFAEWTSTHQVGAVIVKGGNAFAQFPGGTSGTIENTHLLNRGGNEADISNVQFCGPEPPPPAVPEEECGPCEGKMTFLRLLNMGDAAQTQIRVEGKRGPTTDVLFDDSVDAGEAFEFSGLPHANPGFDGTLGTDIDIYVNDEFHVRIHTSCSQPIAVGMVFNGFEILAGRSKHGGWLTPDEPPQVSYEVVEENGVFFVEIEVTSKVPLKEVNINTVTLPAGDPPTDPELVFEEIEEETDFDQGIAKYRALIPSVFHEYEIRVEAIDICGLRACPLDVIDPPSYLVAPPQDEMQTFRDVTVTDPNGIELISFFNLQHTKVQDLEWTKGATSASFRLGFDIQPGQFAVFGFLLANPCHARVFDPELESAAALSRALSGVDRGSQFVSSDVPDQFELGQNYPNPFNPATQISFGLPESSQVSLIVYDMMGRQVAVLADGAMDAGFHQVTFDAHNLAGGTYFYTLVTPEGSITQKMVLIK